MMSIVILGKSGANDETFSWGAAGGKIQGGNHLNVA
jgi:hypothetical protein